MTKVRSLKKTKWPTQITRSKRLRYTEVQNYDSRPHLVGSSNKERENKKK